MLFTVFRLSLRIEKQARRADVAQLVEQSIRNRQVIGSSPIVGSSKLLLITYLVAALAALAFGPLVIVSLIPVT